MKVRNTFIIFLVSGFWHGANWTFLVWDALNAIYFLPLLLTKKNHHHLGDVAEGRNFPNLKETSSIFIIFGLTVLAWIFFRAKNISHAIRYLSGIFSKSLFSMPEFMGKTGALITLILILIFTLVEWIGREKEFAIEEVGNNWEQTPRYGFYYLIIITIIYFGNFGDNQFIYFQF
jgi:alginate O-acetyltransferase complex protein AlgI